MSRLSHRISVFVWLVLVPHFATGQPSAGLDSHENFALKNVPRRILADQQHFLTSPMHVKQRDLSWLIPVGVLSGLLIASDQHNMNAQIKSNQDAIRSSTGVTNASLGAWAAVPAWLYVFHYNSHLREGAMLATESLVDSLIAGTALKLAFGRERPAA